MFWANPRHEKRKAATMLVRMRKEGDQVLVYFLDSRHIIGVNELGAAVIDLIFNKRFSAERAASSIAQEHEVPIEVVREDIREFIAAVEEELEPERYNNNFEQSQTDVPLGVELEITTSCNLRCRHCLQASYAEEHMPKERAIGILEAIAQAGVFEVSIIGGEPLRHPHFLDILRGCEERDLTVNVVTNGLLISDTMAKSLASARHLAILVSIDGTESQHDRIRGKGTFRKAEAAIRRLTARGAAVEVLFTLNAENAASYRDVLNHCKSLGVPCNFNLFKPFKPEHSGLVLQPEAFFAVVIDLFRLRQNGEYQIGISNAAIVGKLIGDLPYNECRAALSGLVIDTHGRMLTCPSLVFAGFYRPDELPRFDGNFVETWRNHEIFRRFRQDGFKGCQARSFIFCGDTVTPDPYGIEAFTAYLDAVGSRQPQSA